VKNELNKIETHKDHEEPRRTQHNPWRIQINAYVVLDV